MFILAWPALTQHLFYPEDFLFVLHIRLRWYILQDIVLKTHAPQNAFLVLPEPQPLLPVAASIPALRTREIMAWPVSGFPLHLPSPSAASESQGQVLSE